MLKLLSSTATLVMVIFAIAFSQAPPPEGPPGPPNGSPGPGSRMFRGPGFGMPGLESTGLVLLGLPDVRKELELTAEQQTSVDELMALSQQELHNSLAEFGPAELFDADDKRRQQKMDEFRSRSDVAVEKADSRLAHLLTKPQAARLAELRLQREGAPALLRPEIGKQLDLTNEQQTKLAELENAARPQFGPGRGGPADFVRMEQTRNTAHADMLAVLTESQKAQWDALVGKPFTFPPMQFGPGRGRGKRARSAHRQPLDHGGLDRPTGSGDGHHVCRNDHRPGHRSPATRRGPHPN